jgi:hypothetical protein
MCSDITCKASSHKTLNTPSRMDAPPQERIEAEKARLASTRVPDDSALAAAAAGVSGQGLPRGVTLQDLLRRPHVHHGCAAVRLCPSRAVQQRAPCSSPARPSTCAPCACVQQAPPQDPPRTPHTPHAPCTLCTPPTPTGCWRSTGSALLLPAAWRPQRQRLLRLTSSTKASSHARCACVCVCASCGRCGGQVGGRQGSHVAT